MPHQGTRELLGQPRERIRDADAALAFAGKLFRGAAALAELLPRADFPLQMNLVPQFSENGSAEVRVLLSVASGVAGQLDVLIASFDHMFTPVGSPLKQRLAVPVAAVAGSAAFQWTSVLKPPPGDYEVRAAVATYRGLIGFGGRVRCLDRSS